MIRSLKFRLYPNKKDRDINAAVNILKRGNKIISQELADRGVNFVHDEARSG